MTTFRIAVSLVLAAGAGLFALRHHSLRRLHIEHTQLEERSGQVALQSPAISSAPAPVLNSTNAELSAAERSELLRLRGQVGSLRRELTQATNELVRLSAVARAASAGSPEEPIVSKAEAVQKMSAGRQWMIALIMYAQDHQLQLPGTLAEATPYAGTNKIDGTEFEFVRTNLDMLRIKSPATTIVLRETKSWKTYNGRWNRTYAFADGHIENAVSDVNDFTEWEAKHGAVDPSSGQ